MFELRSSQYGLIGDLLILQQSLYLFVFLLKIPH